MAEIKNKEIPYQTKANYKQTIEYLIQPFIVKPGVKIETNIESDLSLNKKSQEFSASPYFIISTKDDEFIMSLGFDGLEDCDYSQGIFKYTKQLKKDVDFNDKSRTFINFLTQCFRNNPNIFQEINRPVFVEIATLMYIDRQSGKFKLRGEFNLEKLLEISKFLQITDELSESYFKA